MPATMKATTIIVTRRTILAKRNTLSSLPLGYALCDWYPRTTPVNRPQSRCGGAGLHDHLSPASRGGRGGEHRRRHRPVRVHPPAASGRLQVAGPPEPDRLERPPVRALHDVHDRHLAASAPAL